MSIGAKPWEGGGAASVPDASETVKGKIRIATTAESTAGLDDLTAMTPAKVKARIDAALVGGVEYKGEYTGQSLVTALKGDMYISSGSQTLGGVSLSNGDHIIFNEDAANPVTSSMFDVIDNTETPASETVAGVIEIATNAEATAASATDKALVPSNISSIDLSSFDNDLSANDFLADHVASNYTPANNNIDGHLSGIDSALASVGGNQITLIDTKSINFTAASNAIYDIQSSLTVTMPGSPSEGDLIGFVAQGTATPSLTVSGTLETVNNVQTTSTTIEVNKRVVVWWGYNGARWQQLNDSLKVATASLAGVLETASNAEATAASATDRALTPSNIGSINVGDLNDDSTYQLRDAGLTSIAGLTTSANQMLYTTGSDAYDVTSITAAGRAILDDVDAAAQRTTLGLVIGTNVLGDVVDDTTPQLGGPLDVNSQAITSASNGNVEITPNGTGAIKLGGNTNPAEVRFFDEAGTNYVALKAPADASISADETFTLPAADGSPGQVLQTNGSGVLSFVSQSSGGATDLDGLSDVTITTPTSSGQILRNNGSGQFVNTSLSIVDDTTPQLGGALDVNGQAITSASNGNVTINPDGTGDISVGADVIPDADATHTLGSEGNRFITLHSELNGAVQFKARNETGGPLTKGQAVYISGLSGSVPLVSLARANSASTMPAHGLLAADVSNNADVQVISFGNLTEYNTTTHSLSLGDTVYVSAATAGALTSSAPAGETNLIQNIGKVVRASATEGIIKVGGAGRSAATPNLDNGKIFLGNASNQAVSTALSSAAVTSFNTQTGALTIGGDDLTADHTAVHYTAANANIDGHFSGIDSALALKAPLASPSFTGTPTAPTATQGDNSTKLATTAYVDTAVSGAGGGWTYSAITADPANAQAGYHYSCTGTFTITLPTTGVSAGEEVRIKNMGTGTITIDPQTSNIDADTIDYVMDVQYGAITLVSTGTHWEII